MKMVKNDLYDYPNRYIYQFEDCFKFSLDSILLAEFVKLPNNNIDILDMCTGNAPVPLILSTKTKSKIFGFEIQNEIVGLAKKSVQINNLDSQIKIINDDILNIDEIFPGKYFDIITCNPPYFPKQEDKVLNKNEFLTIARHEIKITLDEIFEIANKHLKDNGDFYLVHRPDRLDEIIILAKENNIPVKEIQLIVTKDNIPSIVLIHCKKHGKFGIKFRKIIDVNKYSTYQHMFEEGRK